jgi:hypothetical protein
MSVNKVNENPLLFLLMADSASGAIVPVGDREATVEQYANLISDLLIKETQHNAKQFHLSSDGTCFSCVHNKRPTIEIKEYICNRLTKYTKASKEELVMAICLVDRLVSQQNNVKVTFLSVHRIFATSLVIVLKFHEDRCFLNSFYATVIGISVTELNALELEFLRLISFRSWISLEILTQYMSQLTQ